MKGVLQGLVEICKKYRYKSLFTPKLQYSYIIVLVHNA